MFCPQYYLFIASQTLTSLDQRHIMNIPEAWRLYPDCMLTSNLEGFNIAWYQPISISHWYEFMQNDTVLLQSALVRAYWLCSVVRFIYLYREGHFTWPALMTMSEKICYKTTKKGNVLALSKFKLYSIKEFEITSTDCICIYIRHTLIVWAQFLWSWPQTTSHMVLVDQEAIDVW